MLHSGSKDSDATNTLGLLILSCCQVIGSEVVVQLSCAFICRRRRRTVQQIQRRVIDSSPKSSKQTEFRLRLRDCRSYWLLETLAVHGQTACCLSKLFTLVVMSVIPRLHDEAGSTSARRAHARRALDERSTCAR